MKVMYSLAVANIQALFGFQRLLIVINLGLQLLGQILHVSLAVRRKGREGALDSVTRPKRQGCKSTRCSGPRDLTLCVLRACVAELKKRTERA